MGVSDLIAYVLLDCFLFGAPGVSQIHFSASTRVFLLAWLFLPWRSKQKTLFRPLIFFVLTLTPHPAFNPNRLTRPLIRKYFCVWAPLACAK